MKKVLLSLFPVFLLMMATQALQAQCNAEFTWEQLPGTLQIHFNSTSTSEHDIVSYNWNFGDGHEGDGSSPYHTYAEPGTYLVCLIITDSEGCVSDVCHQVTIEGLQSDCNAEFTWEQIPGTLQIHFNSTSTSEHDIEFYHWNFGDNHEGDGSNPYHTYSEPGTYLVCLIIETEDGCISDVCHEITVEAIPPSECNAEFIWEQFSGSLEIDFTNTSTSDHDIVSFNWNFGDGHEGDGPNPTHTYAEPGTYLVCLIIETEDGCVSDVCHEVTVEPLSGDCHAQFTWEQIPGSLEIHFNSTSTSQNDIVSYVWHFGDGDEGDGNDPYHTYDHPGVYLVCLIITDSEGCVSDECHEVTVEPLSGDCHAQFTWEQIPGTLQIHFNSTSTSQNDIASYVWHFGDGDEGDGNDPYHTYDHPGVYLVCLIITDSEGCVSDVCHEVTVEGVSGCHASFNWEQFQDSLAIHFNSTSTSENDIISYQWNFGDGSEGDGQNPNHTYSEPGTYLVCLIITDSEGCVSDVCHEVTVEGETSGCHAIFTWDLIPGTNNVHFFSHSTSEHDIISYHWTFGDGHDSNDQNPIHEYAEPGVYLVCLRIEDNTGCVSEICHEVTVGEPQEGCQASFNWEQIPGTLQMHFNSTSTSEHDIVSYSWNFGDGHEGEGPNPTHTYAEPGTYLVCLIIETEDGCISDVCHEVTVGEPECNATFTFEVENGIVYFNNNSTGGTQHTTWLWQFGDGNTSTEENPEHEYNQSGMYTVCLFMTDTTNECEDHYCLTLVFELGFEPLNFDEYPESAHLGANAGASLHPDLKRVRYNNPVDQTIFLEYLVEEKGAVQIEIYNLYGHRLSTDRLDIAQTGAHQHSIDVSHLQPGMYLLSVMVNGERKTMGVTISR